MRGVFAVLLGEVCSALKARGAAIGGSVAAIALKAAPLLFLAARVTMPPVALLDALGFAF